MRNRKFNYHKRVADVRGRAMMTDVTPNYIKMCLQRDELYEETAIYKRQYIEVLEQNKNLSVRRVVESLVI